MRPKKWGVICAKEVNRFRHTLSPTEAELFNECLARIYRNPRADRIRKFQFVRAPLVEYYYRDDNFILFYRWKQYKEPDEPFTVYQIQVYQASRTSDFDADDTIPRI